MTTRKLDKRKRRTVFDRLSIYIERRKGFVLHSGTAP